MARQMPASQKNRPCQLITDSDHWTGKVAAIEPSAARHHVEAGDQRPSAAADTTA